MTYISMPFSGRLLEDSFQAISTPSTAPYDMVLAGIDHMTLDLNFRRVLLPRGPIHNQSSGGPSEAENSGFSGTAGIGSAARRVFMGLFLYPHAIISHAATSCILGSTWTIHAPSSTTKVPFLPPSRRDEPHQPQEHQRIPQDAKPAGPVLQDGRSPLAQGLFHLSPVPAGTGRHHQKDAPGYQENPCQKGKRVQCLRPLIDAPRLGSL